MNRITETKTKTYSDCDPKKYENQTQNSDQKFCPKPKKLRSASLKPRRAGELSLPDKRRRRRHHRSGPTQIEKSLFPEKKTERPFDAAGKRIFKHFYRKEKSLKKI
ncbi:hypothetical protein F2P81_024562 [Scophthalmus maximus]|uniref:Uncharacterized protein n=1 Tax=Scophthalmus maximus TaxID=52904 RepID=A0A6A4RXV4_SCOMX|nr:hypothetical protein F2P81_024562 [Scophthalmus maximus]